MRGWDGPYDRSIPKVTRWDHSPGEDGYPGVTYWMMLADDAKTAQERGNDEEAIAIREQMKLSWDSKDGMFYLTYPEP